MPFGVEKRGQLSMIDGLLSMIVNVIIVNRGLIYSEYLGDGDTSSFNDVVQAKPYEEYSVDPKKLECVGHVQKRLGTRLRVLVKKHAGNKDPKKRLRQRQT